MYQRRSGKMGKTLGKTTGWIHRTTLKNNEAWFNNQASFTATLMTMAFT